MAHAPAAPDQFVRVGDPKLMRLPHLRAMSLHYLALQQLLTVRNASACVVDEGYKEGSSDLDGNLEGGGGGGGGSGGGGCARPRNSAHCSSVQASATATATGRPRRHWIRSKCATYFKRIFIKMFIVDYFHAPDAAVVIL
eukprot:2715570-Pleurochrysis_carterae.AAC.2